MAVAHVHDSIIRNYVEKWSAPQLVTRTDICFMSMNNITGMMLFSLQTICVFWDMAISYYNDGLGIMGDW